MSLPFGSRPPPPGPRSSPSGTRPPLEASRQTAHPTANVTPRPSVLDEEPIPRMKTVAPSIFVPLTTDITVPRPPPATGVEKLERVLAATKAHRAGVLENIAYLADHELRAIRQYGRQMEALEGTPARPGPGVPPEEVDWLMENMAAPAPKGRDLNLMDEDDLRHRIQGAVGVTQPPAQTRREEAARGVLRTINAAVSSSMGFRSVIDAKIADYEKMLEKERKRAEDAGKRPEDRR